MTSYCKSGVSNLFDWRAKCTNFKLVGGQSEMPASRRGKGMGRVCPPPQPTREPPPAGSGAEPRQKTSFGIF